MKSGMRETLLQEWEHTEKLIRNEFMKRFKRNAAFTGLKISIGPKILRSSVW